MILCTSITSNYLERSQPFFTSAVKHWPHRRICFTIGFIATIEGWETIQVQPECEWRPKNRSTYYSLQHGEFIKHMRSVNPEEMILFCDSDMILQRPFDLDMPATNKILVTGCSWPQLKLMEVVGNLKPARRADKVIKKWGILVQREFCGCFIIAKAKIWLSIYHRCKELYPLLNEFEHHAAWQLLVNLAIHGTFKMVLLPEHICNASWYEGTRAAGSPLSVDVMSIGDQSVVSKEVVYFNHTKFDL